MEIRPMERNGRCRTCRKETLKGCDILFESGYRDNIIICMDCVAKIALMYEKDQGSQFPSMRTLNENQ